MTGRRRARLPPRAWIAILGAVAAVAFLAGDGAAQLTIVAGTESATGSAESAAAVLWWSVATFAVDTVPATVPGSASTSAAAPSGLPGANGSFAAGAATALDAAVRWDFVEKNAPGSTEFELIVLLLNGTSVPVAGATVYFETQASPPGPITVSVFLDVGSTAPSGGNATELAVQCASIGSCPSAS